MPLRLHQKAFINVIDRIISGSDTHRIIVHAVPGGGKSALPVIAGKLITYGLADKIAWICPRLALKDQGERVFLDPYFRKLLGHNLTIRSSTNEPNPSRGTNGFISTFQSLSVDDKKTVYKDFCRYRYILVLDEFHHLAEEGSDWKKNMQPIVDKAEYLILMTGTLSRGDEKQIAWIDYENSYPKLTGITGTEFIRYTRREALQEKAILPINFILSDGEVEWQNKKGDHKNGKLSERVCDAGEAIFTALSTEFAEKLLEEGVKHWKNYKITHPFSKLLIVTANYKSAIKHNQTLNTMGVHSKIATSHDSKDAIKNIKEFKFGKLDVLTSIAICYEGLDVPDVTHIIILTHIRSSPWIEQCISREVRVSRRAGPYSSQKGFVFAPDDFWMKKIILQIQAEQITCAKGSRPTDEAKGISERGEECTKGEHNPFGVVPIGSKLTDRREFQLGEAFSFESYQIPAPPKTQSEIEQDLRETIEKHLRKYSFANYYKMQRINSEVMAASQGKARKDMTVPELRDLLSYVRMTYPLERAAPGPEHETGISLRRGSGHRVPTKAIPWQQSSLFEECI